MFDHLDDPHPPAPDLDRVLGRGQRLRRRRTVLQGAAGALVAVTAVGGAVLAMQTVGDDSSLVPASPAVTAPPVTSSAPPAASPSVTAASSPYCVTDDLTVTVGGPGDSGAGTRSTYVIFTNGGSTPCILNGHPGVSYVAAGAQVGASADLVDATQRVTLPPGGVGHARVLIGNYQNYDASECLPTAVDSWSIIPPDQTEPVRVPAPGTGCANDAVRLLQVGTVRAGEPVAGEP